MIWVIVNRLTKSAHFLAVRMTFTLEEFSRLYMQKIVQLHGVPVSIVSDRDPRFMSHLEELLKGGDVVDNEHCISSTNRWSVGEDNTYFRGHVTSMRPGS